MKKKITAITALLAVLFTIVPVSAAGVSETILIYADEAYFTEFDNAYSALIAIAGIPPEQCFPNIYAFALNGSSELCERINAHPGFDAHFSGSFKALSTEYSDYKMSMTSASEMMNFTSAEKNDFTGKGVIVAVIDSGFDVTHPVFEKSPAAETLTRERLSELGEVETLNAAQYIDPSLLYINAKLPFAFNYAENNNDVSTDSDHGTHVAAIIAGDNDTVQGIAPDCQLLLMKIFGNNSENASELDLVAALEDAAALGADVINMSLGIYSGYSSRERSPEMKNAIKRLNSKGITVVCAAGNDGTIGYQSTFKKTSSVEYPLAKITDYGTVNSPSSITDFISVASAQNSLLSVPVLTHSASGRTIRFSDSNTSQGVTETDFAYHIGKGEFEYQSIPGVGSRSDYAGLELRGKIALIERGTITFAEKVKISAECGAIAAIIYDNSDEGLSLLMAIENSEIPAIFISKEDGEFLKNAIDKKITIDPSIRLKKENPNSFEMSSFSSWGVTPELELKPDITAIGDSVYSAGTNGKYVSLSGTSMAAPFISGFAALLIEKSGGRVADINTEIKTALMNTASPLIDPDTNAEYSPRLQGSGLADIGAALRRKLKITANDGSPSLSIGDKLNLKSRIKFDITLENLSDEPLDLTLSASLLKESAIELGTNKLNFNSLNVVPLKNSSAYINDVKITDGGSIGITIAQKDTETLSVTLILDSDELSDNAFENGLFIDGFIYACENNSCKYSLPFTGFTEDFDSSLYIDDSIYESGTPFLGGTMLISYFGKTAVVLGSSDLSADSKIIDSGKIAISPDFDGNLDDSYIKIPLYRNVTGYSVEVKDQTGVSLMKNSEKLALPKSGYYTPILKLWDGGDGINEKFRFDDGEYTVTVKVWQSDSKKGETVEFPITLDTEPPTLSGYSIEFENGKMYLEIKAQDNHYVREVFVYSEPGDERFAKAVDNGTDCFRIDISGYNKSTIWLDITDYAMNTTTEPLELSSLYPNLSLDFFTIQKEQALNCAPSLGKFGMFAELFNIVTAGKENAS